MKMKNIYLIFSLMITLFSCREAVEVEPGVSRELAIERKGAVSDITYDLSIAVDSLTDVNPSGCARISFDYRPTGNPLQIDFAGEEVVDLKVNDISISPVDWRNGHIVIPSSALKSGSNSVDICFVSAGRALNRNPGYMYTLFVPNRAHSVFPCFDQPDMKASYNLSLSVPSGWKAVSNSPVTAVDEKDGKSIIEFGATEPLSTYLFAFSAGEFDYREYSGNGRTIGAYYREKDTDRLAQLDEIFSQVNSSLDQLEDYTGIKYPFAKYDLVILPGFQFGGMEHTGATFYNDNTIFLGKNATGADELKRAKLIAHETAHMWFGDYVTMEWFDDVWTKEVFANYFAAMLTRQLLPEFDHDLEWLRVYMAAALDQDRSEGSTPIRQELDNLKNAGLIYNNIIYNKSPIMMGKLAELVGEENFRKGIRKYLDDHAYGNATWDDLVSALAAFSEQDVEGFSRSWVYEAGMPEISFRIADGQLVATQKDPKGRAIVWPQTFDVAVSDGVTTEMLTVGFDGKAPVVGVPTSISSESGLIVPVADGRAYGLMTLDEERLAKLMEDAVKSDGLVGSLPPVGQLATLMMLNENYLAGNIATPDWIDFLTKRIRNTIDPQMLSALTGYLSPALQDMPADSVAPYEEALFDLASSHPEKQGRTLILKTLISRSRSDKSIGRLLEMWKSGESETLGKDDFSNMALQLAIVLPEIGDSIIKVQRERIGSGDRLRKFDFVSRAAVSDTLALDSLFESLRDPANRLVEPWTLSLLSLLNHPSRHERSVKYIIPALEMLPDIQATGDIFFPASWAATLLGSYRSPEALSLVNRFLKENKEMNPLLLNKVRQGASRLNAKTL